MSVHYASERMDWGTPPGFFGRIQRLFALDLDVAATAHNALCARFYGVGGELEDGLSAPWDGRCWMNPPYGREISKWTARAAERTSIATPIVVGLVPARTDTRWWHDSVMPYADEIILVRGRLRFVGAPASAPFPSAVVVWRLRARGGRGQLRWTVMGATR